MNKIYIIGNKLPNGYWLLMRNSAIKQAGKGGKDLI